VKTVLAAFIASIITAPTYANDQEISVTFRESAPKDSFTILNTGACQIDGLVSIDLASSEGKLIFDTTATGAGVEVFQPFAVVAGQNFLVETPVVTDGDTIVQLSLKGLKIGDKVSFTIDVDDTLQNSNLGQIRVTGSEISGARVTVGKSAKFSDQFGQDAVARLSMGDCSKA
jgi:hypothetical protein